MSQTATPATPRFFRASQLAKLMYCSTKTVDNMRRRGELVAVPLGRQFRYPADQAAVLPFLPKNAATASTAA